MVAVMYDVCKEDSFKVAKKAGKRKKKFSL